MTPKLNLSKEKRKKKKKTTNSPTHTASLKDQRRINEQDTIFSKAL